MAASISTNAVDAFGDSVGFGDFVGFGDLVGLGDFVGLGDAVVAVAVGEGDADVPVALGAGVGLVVVGEDEDVGGALDDVVGLEPGPPFPPPLGGAGDAGAGAGSPRAAAARVDANDGLPIAARGDRLALADGDAAVVALGEDVGIGVGIGGAWAPLSVNPGSMAAVKAIQAAATTATMSAPLPSRERHSGLMP
jgi:hypothetical protein